MNYTDLSLQPKSIITNYGNSSSGNTNLLGGEDASNNSIGPCTHDIDLALKKLAELKKIDAQGLLLEEITNNPLPAISQANIQSLVDFLQKPCSIKQEGLFEISFNLYELFLHLFNNKQIVQVELVGSGAPYILGDYVLEVFKSMGIKNPKEIVTDRMLKEYCRYPSDFDFRIQLPYNSEDITKYKEAVIDFFVSKIKNGSTDNKSKLKELIIKKGFTKLTDPIINDGNYCLTMAFQNTDKVPFDLILVKQLKRQSLFVQDAFRLPILSLVLAIQYNLVNGQNVIIPVSDYKNGWQAVLDRMTGVIRAISPETIDLTGLITLLSCYQKGKRCFDINLETQLFTKLYQTMSSMTPSSTSFFLLPPALQKKLKPLQKKSPNERFVIALAYYLEKTIVNHLKNDPSAGLFLILQTCLKSYEEGYKELVPALLKNMNFFLKFENKEEITCLIATTLNQGTDVISVIHLIQTFAFMHLCLKQEESPDTSPLSYRLIQHKGAPTLQIGCKGYYLLLPFTPLQSLKDSISSFGSDIDKNPFEVLSKKLKPKHPYKNNTNGLLANYLKPLLLDISTIETLYEPLRLNPLLPREMHQIEWLICLKTLFKNDYVSDILEEVFLRYITKISDRDEKVNLTKTLCNLSHSDAEHILYDTMIQAVSEQNRPLFEASWTIALAATKLPKNALKAFHIWYKLFDRIDSAKRIPMGLTLISHMQHARPDLAFKIWSHLHKSDSEGLKKYALRFWNFFHTQITKKNYDIAINIIPHLFYDATLIIKDLPERLEEWIVCFEILLPFMILPKASEETKALLSFLSTHLQKWILQCPIPITFNRLSLLKGLMSQLESAFPDSLSKPIPWGLKFVDSLLKIPSFEPQFEALMIFKKYQKHDSSLNTFMSIALLPLSPPQEKLLLSTLFEYFSDGNSTNLDSFSKLMDNPNISKLLDTHQSILYNSFENKSFQYKIDLMRCLSTLNVSMTCSKETAALFLDILKAQFKSSDTPSSSSIFTPFIWLLRHCPLSNYPNQLKSFYYDYLLLFKDSPLTNDLEFLLKTFFTYIEKDGLPVEELTYIEAFIDYYYLFFNKDFNLSKDILKHIFHVSNVHRATLVTTTFKSLLTAINKPLYVILQLDAFASYFQQYISQDTLIDLYRQLIQVLINENNITSLKFLFVSLSKGYNLSLQSWRIVLTNSYNFDSSLLNVIQNHLFNDFQKVLFLGKDPAERIHFCLYVVGNFCALHPPAFIPLLNNMQLILDSTHLIYIEKQRLDFINAIFLNSLLFLKNYEKNTEDTLLKAWKEALNITLAHLDAPFSPMLIEENEVERLKMNRSELKGVLKQSKMLVIAKSGDKKEFESLLKELPEIIHYLNSISFKNSQILVGFDALLRLPTERRVPIIPLTISYLEQQCKDISILDVVKNGFKELMDFIQNLSDISFNLKEMEVFFKRFHEANHPRILEAGSLFAIALLASVPNRPKPEQNLIIKYLSAFLEKLSKSNCRLSNYFSNYFFKSSEKLKPYIEKNSFILKPLMNLFDYSGEFDLVIVFIDCYSKTILKDDQLYPILFNLVTNDLINLHKDSPKKFNSVLIKYSDNLISNLLDIYQSAAKRKSIVALFSNTIMAPFIPTINFESGELNYSLAALDLIMKCRVDAEAFNPMAPDNLLNSYIYLPIPDAFPKLQQDHFKKKVPEILLRLVDTKKTNKTIQEYLLLIPTKVHPSKPDLGAAFLKVINSLVEMKIFTGYELALRILLYREQELIEHDSKFGTTHYLDCWKKFITHFSSVPGFDTKTSPFLNIIIQGITIEDPVNPFCKVHKSELWQVVSNKILMHVFATLSNPECTLYAQNLDSISKSMFIYQSSFLCSCLPLGGFINLHKEYLGCVKQVMKSLMECANEPEFDRLVKSFLQLLTQKNILIPLKEDELLLRSELVRTWLDKLKLINDALYKEYLQKTIDLSLI